MWSIAKTVSILKAYLLTRNSSSLLWRRNICMVNKIDIHNALVIKRAIGAKGGRAFVGSLKVYYSDVDALYDAVFYARELGLVKTDINKINSRTEVILVWQDNIIGEESRNK
jgi:hypothetical protein